MLTDGDLKKLGSLSKSNPQKKEWSAMKLYLLEQVRPLPVWPIMPRVRSCTAPSAMITVIAAGAPQAKEPNSQQAVNDRDGATNAIVSMADFAGGGGGCKQARHI